MYVEKDAAFTLNGAMGARVRVKLTAGSVTDPPQVEAAGAGEQHIGYTKYAGASGDVVTIEGRMGNFIKEVVSAEAFNQGAVLYGGAAGTVQDTSAGSAIGVAVEAASGAGEIVQMVDFGVLSTTAATVSIEDTGTFTDAATVEAALAEIYQHLVTAQGCILVPLGAITQEDGTALTKQATTVAGFAQLGGKETVIKIPVDCTAGDVLGAVVPVPQDLDDSADIEIHVLAGKDADNDALTLDCEVYPSAAGDVGNADIQDTAAQTITQAVSELVFTCGADGVLAAPGTLSIVLTQGGTNDGDAVYIYGVWVEYKKKILAA